MKKITLYLTIVSLSFLMIISCKKNEEIEPSSYKSVTKYKNTIPEFYQASLEENYGMTPPTYATIATSSDNISTPQDLDFSPSESNPDELWIINKGTENAPTYGGSTVIIHNAGKSNQSAEYRQDQNAWHFMSMPTAIAFGAKTYLNEYTFAISPGVFDANHAGSGFTGPSLWSADLSVYAKPSGGNGSHLDMLHGSPYSMGIAHEKDNIYWVFDGYNKEIVRYDFGEDHGPGNDDHADAKVHRYRDVVVTRDNTVPSHLVVDKQTGWLYICETSKSRVLRLNINSGNKKSNLSPINEPLEEHWEMENTEWEIFTDNNLTKPCGIEVNENRLFVSDYSTGEIIAYDVSTKAELGRIQTGAAGIMGIKVGPDGKLWFVDFLSNKVERVDPVQVVI